MAGNLSRLYTSTVLRLPHAECVTEQHACSLDKQAYPLDRCVVGLRLCTVGQIFRYSCRVDLTVNYVTLYAKHKLIHQFHVSFDPAIESLSMKIGLLNEHKGLLKVKLFDGSIMYLPEPLPDKVGNVLACLYFVWFACVCPTPASYVSKAIFEASRMTMLRRYFLATP